MNVRTVIVLVVLSRCVAHAQDPVVIEAEQRARGEREKLVQDIADEIEGRADGLSEVQRFLRRNSVYSQLAAERKAAAEAGYRKESERLKKIALEAQQAAANRERATELAEQAERTRLLKWAFGPGLTHQKVLRESKGGGKIERDGKVIELAGRVVVVTPIGGIPEQGVVPHGDSFVPADGWVWVFPLEAEYLAVARDFEEPTGEQFREAVEQSWKRVFEKDPALSTDHAFEAFVQEARNDDRFAVMFSFSQWPELLVERWATTIQQIGVRRKVY